VVTVGIVSRVVVVPSLTVTVMAVVAVVTVGIVIVEVAIAEDVIVRFAFFLSKDFENIDEFSQNVIELCKIEDQMSI